MELAIDSARSRRQRRPFKLAATASFVGVLAVVAAACGGMSGNSTTKASTGGTGATKSTTAPVSRAATKPSIELRSSSQFGKFLTSPSGFALYTYTADKAGGKGCTGECLKVWPPLLLPSGMTAATAGKGVSGLGTFHRSGRLQVTYRGLPLYTFVKDETPDQVMGQGVTDPGGKWILATVGAAPKGASKSSSTTSAPSSGGGAF